MRYQVPQFIEIEDKIFGPLTLKQFIYLAGGTGVCVVLYLLLPIYLAIPVMLPFAGLTLALAFWKINNRPFIDTLEAFFKFSIGPKLYIWKKLPQKATTKKEMEAKKDETSALIPRLSESKLKELSWSLDIKENPLSDEEENEIRGNF